MTDLYPNIQIALKSPHGGYLHATHSGRVVRKTGVITRSAKWRVDTIDNNNNHNHNNTNNNTTTNNFTKRVSLFSVQNRCFLTAEEDGSVCVLKKHRDTWDQWVVTAALRKKKE